MDKYIHNTSGATKIYLGIEVADNDYLLLPELTQVRAKEDDTIIADITADDARMSRDGATDLSIADSLIFLQLDDATSITGIVVDTTVPTNGQYLIYNNTSGEYKPDISQSAIGTLLQYNYVGNGNTQNKWLSFSSGGFSPSDDVPMIVPQDSLIKGVTYTNSLDNTDCNICIHINGTLTHTEEIRNKRAAWIVGSLSVSLNQGDRLSIYIEKVTTGTGASNPQNVLVSVLGKFTAEISSDTGIQNGLI